MNNTHIWMTKDGKEIEIKDMSDQHLLNCVGYAKMIKEKYNGNWRPFLMDVVNKEIEQRGLVSSGRWTFEF